VLSLFLSRIPRDAALTVFEQDTWEMVLSLF